MSGPSETLVRAGRIVASVGRTWRFRDARDPSSFPRFPEGPVILAAWHEYLIAGALFGRDRQITSLASRHADGELISRIVTPLGYAMARGSSSRGGAGGFRELLRAAAAGRTLFMAVDGPRGPRHVCQPGVLRLAEHTGLPIVPLGMATGCGARMGSWDRMLIPAPGARVFVRFGAPLRADEASGLDEHRLGAAIDREVARCEALVEEGRAGPVYGSRRPDAGAGRRAATGGSAGRIERRVRGAWLRPDPPPDLRVLSAAFAGARTARHAAYDTGLLRGESVPIPVVSVGGLTVGGSGKTPLVSELAVWLTSAGHRPAILTRGYEDELALHARQRPQAIVLGHPDRVAIARRAAAAGATVALLDDGFQHRRLARDLDVVAVDLDALRRTNRATFPAGPFRESPARLRRADAAVLVGREPRSRAVVEFERVWLDRAPRPALTSRATLESLPPEHRAGPRIEPTVALTGVMKPNLFFDFVRRTCPSVREQVALPDHGWPDRGWEALLGGTGDRGVVMTAKDHARFAGGIPGDVAVWVVPERLVWHDGADELAARVIDAAGEPAGC
ncbi:MAG: tetraacyldisaccharide 4'-kinase [Gemmatimonadota bacterium]|nr:tetraacyldisaccharide 4'-kinase [Gemmatimonadota bacterium]